MSGFPLSTSIFLTTLVMMFEWLKLNIKFKWFKGYLWPLLRIPYLQISPSTASPEQSCSEENIILSTSITDLCLDILRYVFLFLNSRTVARWLILDWCGPIFDLYQRMETLRLSWLPGSCVNIFCWVMWSLRPWTAGPGPELWLTVGQWPILGTGLHRTV